MSKAVALAIAIGATGCTDRGECLSAHAEQRWYEPPPIYINIGGGVMFPVMQPGYYVDVNVCDQWQYPNGKPMEVK